MKRLLATDALKRVGKKVKLAGWIDSRRDHGKIIFLDLRDRSGIVQLVLKNNLGKPKPEDVIEIEGKVNKRPENMVNEKIKTGKIEVSVESLNILSRARELPFPIDTDGYEINEKIRNKYRYLDLRRSRMKNNLRVRSQAVSFIREFLLKKDFVEIETPILTKTTPEGARDFIVPSRLQPGKFYALPQSPQQYKQLLMVAGTERYFQIARCFRDEDPRRDRAYAEFTQLDLEMSFVVQDDILKLTEKLFTNLVQSLFPDKKITQSPWPRIPHAEAQRKFGSDKPDLRRDKNNKDELAFAWIIDFPLFTKQNQDDFYHGSGTASFAPSHHMFTAPHPDDIELLAEDPTRVRGLQHDMVLNGFEVGGGSIRIHDSQIQEKVFDLIGFTNLQKKQFEHMLTAFSYGVPPHGGIAPGIDRFLFAVLGETSLREVIAFPTSASGTTSVMDAPSVAEDDQLAELHIKIKKLRGGEEVFDAIKTKLNLSRIKYQVYDHEPVHTSRDAAKVRKTPLSWGAKAILMFADTNPIMIAVSGDTKIDISKFKKQYRIKDLRMATAEEVEEVTGVPIGAVPPFGNIFYIPLYIDERLSDNKYVVFNAGLHDRSIKIEYQDFVKVTNPILGSFSK